MIFSRPAGTSENWMSDVLHWRWIRISKFVLRGRRNGVSIISVFFKSPTIRRFHRNNREMRFGKTDVWRNFLFFFFGSKFEEKGMTVCKDFEEWEKNFACQDHSKLSSRDKVHEEISFFLSTWGEKSRAGVTHGGLGILPSSLIIWKFVSLLTGHGTWGSLSRKIVIKFRKENLLRNDPRRRWLESSRNKNRCGVLEERVNVDPGVIRKNDSRDFLQRIFHNARQWYPTR